MELPAQLDTNGAWDETEQRCYDCFCALMKRTPPLQVRGKPLAFDRRRIDSEREEGFWHLITKGKGEDRLFDPSRARCLPWLEAMLTQDLDGLSRWSDIHGSGATRLYFWLEAEDYVVVLQENSRTVSLVTAYSVASWGAKDLQKSKARGTSF